MKLAAAAQMREMDRLAIEGRGIPSLTLMERAAQGILAAAEELREALPAERPRAAVFAGPGNNGGDGVAAARLLMERGWQVRCFLAGSREKMTADCRAMAERLAAAGGALEGYVPGDPDQEAWVLEADAAVDALFGVGLRSALGPPALDAVRLLNRAKARVISADIPSGVEADTGRVLVEAVTADITVTFSMAKPGLFVGEGVLRAGRVTVHPIGIPADIAAGQDFPIETVEAAQIASWLPPRPADGHKGTFGRTYLLAGSVDYTGAPVLAARGAARGGCGLVTLGVPASAWPVAAAKCLTEMAQPLPEENGVLSEKALPILRQKLSGVQALLIGPGLGRASTTERTVRTLVRQADCPLVLDADGINALEGHIDELDARRGRVTILTPHDGEFARLGGDLSRDGRLAAARSFASDHGCVLVLKGHRTITAAPDGRCYVNTTGNSGLAKGGSGDVLAGLITSLLAQGMEPAEAAAAGVWIHGRAGDLLARRDSRRAMSPADLPAWFAPVFRELSGEDEM